MTDAELLARWNELATIQLFQQHPGTTYADITARADALALYLMNAANNLVDTEARLGALELEVAALRSTVTHFADALSALAKDAPEPFRAAAAAALAHETLPTDEP